MTARHIHSRDPHHRNLRRLLAVLQLLVVLAAPPILLLGLVGSPLDPPAPLRSMDVLTQPVDDRTLLWLLAAAAWLLYTHLLASLSVEALRQASGRNLRVPLPGLLFGANTMLASHLVAGLLLTPAVSGGGTQGAALTPAVVRTAVSLPTAAQVMTSVMTAELAPAPILTSQAQSAGAATMGDTAAGARAGLIQCRVLPPEGRDHDTLWDIAERHLGDGTRWREVYELNEGRLMPDGQRLTRASLIHPGWILTLPADAIALDIDRVSTAVASRGTADAAPPASTAPVQALPDRSPTEQAGRDADQPAGPQSRTQADVLPPRGAPVGPAESDRGTASASTNAPTSPSLAAAPEVQGSQPSDAGETTAGQLVEHDDHDVAPMVQGTLALAAVGLLAALTRRRKVAARRRPPGVRAARPSAELLEEEGRLRQQARLADDTAATVRLALLLAHRCSSAAQLKVLWQHPDGSIELCWTEPSLDAVVPAPFQATDRGWLLPADAHRLLYATRQDGQRRQDRQARLSAELDAAPDPCPLLLPVGTRDGSACLVNLEQCGLISLTTDEQAPGPDFGSDAETRPAPRPVELLGAWVQTLAGAPWAELLRTYLPHALSDLGTGLEYVEVWDPITVTPTHFSPAEAAQIRERGSFSAARRANPDLDLEMCELYAGYPIRQLPPAVLAAAAGRTHPLVVMLLEPHPDAEPWTLQAPGRLRIPGIADDLTPLALDPVTHQRLLRLLEHAQDPPQAAPDDPHRAELLAQCPPAISLAARPERDVDPTEATDVASTEQDEPARAGADVPAAPPAVARASEPDDTPADADPVGPLEIGVLGPLTISGTDREPPRQATLDLLAYMAFHRRPLRSREMWDGLWPTKPYNNQTLRSRRHELNQLVKPLLHRRAGGGYQLDELISTDWQRFQSLADGNPDQQLAALALVRGRPFLHGDLDWFHLEGQLAEIEASIADLALDVGQRALKRGDYEAARTAALAGLRGVPYEERLYQIAMHSAAARGATAELRQLRQQLALVLQDELEPDDELQPATAQLLEELQEKERKEQYLKRRREQQ